jgi:hypothetical protein
MDFVLIFFIIFFQIFLDNFFSKSFSRIVSSVYISLFNLFLQNYDELLKYSVSNGYGLILIYIYEIFFNNLDKNHRNHHIATLFIAFLTEYYIDSENIYENRVIAIPQIVHITNVFSEIRKKYPNYFINKIYAIIYISVKISAMIIVFYRCINEWDLYSDDFKLIISSLQIIYIIQLKFCLKLFRINDIFNIIMMIYFICSFEIKNILF